MKRYHNIFLLLVVLLGSVCLLSWGRGAFGVASIEKILTTIAPPDTVKKAKKIDVEIDDEKIPDSLLHPRWKVQRTSPVTYDDLKENSTDLSRPENMRQTVEYNDTLDRYIIGNKIGNTYVTAPIMMTPEEYRKWSEKRSFSDYYRSKNQEILQKKGKEKFDFTDMHFSLGPAEKIFGPGGVRIKTQGTAELSWRKHKEHR